MKTTLGIATLSAVLFLLAACATTDAGKTSAADFADYQGWTKVNTETITGDVTAMLGSAHEGNKGFREVYVNAAGEAVALGRAAYPFPEGTVVVKESYKDSGGSKGALANLTIMAKRESGYDSDNGDWEYIMASPSQSVQMQGKLTMCSDCHAAAFDSDYVFTKR
jgi:hypothetical protein